MSNNRKLLYFLLRAQEIDKSSEQGYAMALVSLLSIVLFTLLAASLTFTNLTKSRTNAFVDSHSSFQVAESGLNKRASDLQTKLQTYSGVSGVNSQGLTDCFGIGIPANASKSAQTATNDFECRNYRFKSNNNASQVSVGGNISLDSGNYEGKERNTYVAYTLVSDKTKYGAGGKSPDYSLIPVGEPYGGLNAAEYKYVVQAIAKKPVGLENVSNLPNYSADQIAAENRRQQGQTPNAGDDALLEAFNQEKNRAGAAAAVVSGTDTEKSDNNISLSMSFVTRVVPLFQFAVFYNGDLEFNSTSKMQVKGWVHSNANIYVQPAGITGEESNSTTDFLATVSAAGKIYNRIDAWDKGLEDGGRNGITRVLLTGDNCDTGTCQNFPYSYPNYSNAITDPLSSTQISAFPSKKVQDGAAGTVVLKTPSPGFTRKRNYVDNTIGMYYSRADMRLEMVPDRDVAPNGKTATPWTRNKAIIPFNFTSVTTGSDNCTRTFTVGSDPAANYIDPTREKASTRQCNVFTKGQLQSLRQPVLVLTKKFHSANLTLEPIEREILGGPTDRTAPIDPKRPTYPSTNLSTIPSLAGVNDANKDKVLRALQVALVSTPAPVTFDRLNTLFSDPVYGDSSNSDSNNSPTCNTGCDVNLNNFKTEFKRLVKTLFPVANPVSPSATDLTNINIRNTLFAASPSEIAALRDAWFLPAPVQRVETTNTATTDNLRSSGFYDSRENRWISMLQTNIASLSVWNRDGLYVTSDNETLTTAYVASTTNRDLAFSDTTTASYSTSGLAFDRSTVDATKSSTAVANLQSLGLGSTDTTEGGLVFHASVRDDLNGDGVMDTNDVAIDKTDTTKQVLKKKPDNTNELDKDGNVIMTDYYRNYPGQNIRKSPFAFAFSGGNYLPNSLVLSSDQSVYVQGNFNNNANNTSALLPNSTANTPSDNRLPASIIADTITALSNECIGDTASPNGVPAKQLKCGLVINTTTTADAVRNPMAINAAFLSNTDSSIGNYHTVGETLPAVTARSYSGGVNNYIRLLEDWGNQYALNYTGSMISLGAPLEYSGAYKSGGGDWTTRTGGDNPYYNIPIRNFNYDDKFNKNENVPPLTPKASYVRQSNFNRVY